MFKTILGFVTGGFSGIWGYVAVAAFAAALSFGGTHYIDAKVYGVQIAKLQTKEAQTQAANVTAALKQLTGFVARMSLADNNYNTLVLQVTNEYSQLKEGLAHVKIASPLPADCRPSPDRVRLLSDAVASANRVYSPAPK